MACGATLKRSMEFEALLSPQSPKRRRCNPLPGTPGTPSPQRCNLRPPVDSPTHSMSPPAIGGEHRLTPEQIFQNLRQEYSRIQRRRQLEGAFNQTEACSSSDAPSPSSSLNAPSSPPAMFRSVQSRQHQLRMIRSFILQGLPKDPWLDLHDQHKSQEAGYCCSSKQSHGQRDCDSRCASRKDQPSFTLKQVSFLCERLLKDHEEKIREEYEQILNTKLAEQYESFVKFTQDQIMRRYGARPASYVS
ncbi:akirin-1 isoform X1 [Dicentrarchus labrax]|uniref:akirin-1 isoform X1 n=1 Tax=Dicentrarchus labrax TaxID=13489 RepID=UPI0021F50047|nr:akirin-1 isoform X1 [Dicentrarchus labrax]